jgi:membrane-bound lytic murein transglycosylase D
VKKTIIAGLLIFAGLTGLYAAGPEPDAEVEGPSFERPLRQKIAAKPARFMSGSSLSSAAFFEESRTELSMGGLENALTQRYIKQYSSPGGIAWLNTVIARGAPYIPFIRAEIERMNLPPELVYLPVIESGFNPVAVSRSGAAGLWQFMKNSMGPFDMKVTDWMDERFDFWKSTQGALRKLDENYRALGDWPLALAAYNAGLGGINRIVKKTGVRDYWVLGEKKELKNETMHYVPKFLAVSHILSNPRRYGIQFWPAEIEWTRVKVEKAADIEIIAEEAGIDAALLKAANRELKFSVSPSGSSYQLKVPVQYAAAVSAALENSSAKLLRYHYYTIKYGDTLSALSRHYGVSVDLIQGANPGLQSRYLKIGAQIRVPAFKDVAVYTGKEGDDGKTLVFEGTHLVKKGETLWAIALAYDVDPAALAEANGMGLNDLLREGRSLKTPILK